MIVSAFTVIMLTLAVVMSAVAMVILSFLGLVLLHQLLEVRRKLEVVHSALLILVIRISPQRPVDLEEILVLVFILQQLRPRLIRILHQMELDATRRAGPLALLPIVNLSKPYLRINILIKVQRHRVLVILCPSPVNHNNTRICT